MSTGVAARGQLIAALLQGGEDCVLSPEAAAQLWGLVSGALTEPTLAVTVAGRRVRTPAGLCVHRVPTLDGHNVRIRDGLRSPLPPARCSTSRPETATTARVRRRWPLPAANGWSPTRRSTISWIGWAQLVATPIAVAVRIGQALAVGRVPTR